MYQPIITDVSDLRPSTTLEVIHELEGDRSADGPQAARQMGRARRRHRHGHGQASTSTARHLRVAAVSTCRFSRTSRQATEYRTWNGQLARSSIRREQVGYHAEGTRAVRVGDPTHRTGPGRDPTRRDSTATMSPTGSMRSASAGTLSRRSVQICRNVLRASLADAVEEGLIPRSPAARVALPRTVAKPVKEKLVQAWETTDVETFLAVIADHRWAVGFQLGVLYGLRRSEVLALRWDDFDPKGRTLRIDESLVAVNRGAVLGDAKNVRSRRLVPLSDDGVALSNDVAPSKPRNDYSPVRSGKTTTSSSPPARVDSYSPVPTTDRWRSSSTRPSCHASHRMVCATQRPLTWSTTRRMSVNSVRLPTSSATARKCS